MKNELRIGNLVYFPLVGRVESIEEDSCYINPRPFEDINNSRPQEQQTTYSGIKPIPLTEEWLLKFGFEKNLILKDRWYIWKLGDFYISDDFRFKSDPGSILIEHTHQLQNLYFALTNTELILKP